MKIKRFDNEALERLNTYRVYMRIYVLHTIYHTYASMAQSVLRVEYAHLLGYDAVDELHAPAIGQHVGVRCESLWVYLFLPRHNSDVHTSARVNPSKQIQLHEITFTHDFTTLDVRLLLRACVRRLPFPFDGFARRRRIECMAHEALNKY